MRRLRRKNTVCVTPKKYSPIGKLLEMKYLGRGTFTSLKQPARSRLVNHPARKAHQKIFETLQVLRRESVFDVCTFEDSFKARQPHFPSPLINFKRKVPSAHAR